jgi:hypothetical protein
MFRPSIRLRGWQSSLLPATLLAPSRGKNAMSAAVLTAEQLTNTILQVLVRTRYRVPDQQWAAIEEGIRRIKEHENLVSNVLPDLRLRLNEAESRTGPKPV